MGLQCSCALCTSRQDNGYPQSLNPRLEHTSETGWQCKMNHSKNPSHLFVPAATI